MLNQTIGVALALLGIIACTWLYLHRIQKTLSRIERLIISASSDKVHDKNGSTSHTDAT